jgi:hypothetical protein
MQPQLRPMMQAPPPTGCTGNAPLPVTSPGDGGAGTTLAKGLMVLVGG